MIVPDCSALAYALLREPGSETVADRLFASDAELHAPHLLDLEVIQVLRKACRSGELDWARASQRFEDYTRLPLVRYSHILFWPRIWELRNNMTAYDAAYVALAEALDAPLLTRDKRLAAAPGHHAKIELV
jgi:predicted nucleic acid-binding protein